LEFSTLYIVSTPIGNDADLTDRAREILRTADIIIAEEPKPARRLLSKLGITKELLLLNEHTTHEATAEALDHLDEGRSIALISDAGTPLLADPGSKLVNLAIDRGHRVVPIPGASSLLAALVGSGLSLEHFTFAGFLSRDADTRKRELMNYRDRKETLVFLEAPYRLNRILDDLSKGLGRNRNAAVCLDLTMPTERFVRNTLGALLEDFTAKPFKGEFVIVVEGARGGGDLRFKR
jgi:16S rRNA (cytidine1402-2'-O)-methyltransferase